MAADGRCAACGAVVAVADLLVAPGPGFAPVPGRDDPVSATLAAPHRLLQPVKNC